MMYRYPIDALNGDILLHDDYTTSITDAIKHCLLTEREERILRPEYGMPDMLFSGTSLQEMETLVKSVLVTGLDGFDVIYSVKCSLDDDGILTVTVLFDENKVEITLT